MIDHDWPTIAGKIAKAARRKSGRATDRPSMLIGPNRSNFLWQRARALWPIGSIALGRRRPAVPLQEKADLELDQPRQPILVPAVGREPV